MKSMDDASSYQETSSYRQLSIESASLALGILLLVNDRAQIEQVIALILRRPDIVLDILQPMVSLIGTPQIPPFDPNALPPTKEELVAIVEPILKEGTRLASYARIFDLYLLKDPL